MPASQPSIAVILVCRNPGPRLHDALESVWSQDFSAELIVIDGASTDGTREWLEHRRAHFARLVSEPDAGVYAAMNKGLRLATADWVLFLGADDRLATSSMLDEAGRLLAKTDADVAVGGARYEDGRLYTFAGARSAIRRNFIHHQAAFYRRDTFIRCGEFDSLLRIQADYDQNLRLVGAGARFATLPLLVAECGAGGLSDAGHWTNYREEIRVRHRHFPAWRCLPWDALAILRYLRKKILRSIAST